MSTWSESEEGQDHRGLECFTSSESKKALILV